MLIKFDKVVNKKQINLFIVLSFFLFFLSFVVSKGFVDDEELSDKIFLITSVILIEILYLSFTNNLIKFEETNFKEYFILLFFFIFNFIIWNSEQLISYTDLVIFFSFHLVLTYFILLFNNLKNIEILKTKNLETFFLILIISILFSGLFSDINYSSTKEFLIILLIAFIFLLTKLIVIKIPIWLDFIISIIIFLTCVKVFLISSIKDAFHYGWYLGPINSISSNYSLLDNIASQYGYFNILLISKISSITNIDSSLVLVSGIIIFLLIFFFLFFFKISENIKLPISIVVTFLSLIIFGNIGFANLSGSMFIPSSSVFRFLPSLLFILYFSKFIEKKINLSQSIFFYILFCIALLWSFESSFFILFPIFSFLTFKFILNINKFNYFEFFLNNKIFFLKGIFIIICIILFVFDKNYHLFYEHALNTNTSLAKEILNNKLTLSFLYLLFVSYLILRDSFSNKIFFYNNILWFSLFVSYSTYFLIRSVDNNIINILPFIVFIICSMKVNSKHINELRKTSLIILVFVCICTSFLSIITKKEIFFSRLKSPNTLLLPKFLESSYKPHPSIKTKIHEFKDTPLTLISGKFVHFPNLNLPNKGYGMPILPLEQFNILNFNIKQKLMNNYFKKNNKHLLLCLNNCEFYFLDKEKKNNKVFLGNSINYEILAKYKNQEFLYLLKKK